MTSNIFLILLLFSKFSFLPSVNDTITIEEWLYLGPFSVGVREGIIGVDEEIELREDFEPDRDITYPSILKQGGKVKWQRVKSKEGKVEIEYKDVLWDTIQDYYGAAGVLSAGYAYADFNGDGRKRALIIAKDVSSFKLNGKTFAGDRYKDGYLKIPVILNKGKNRLLLKLSGFGDHKFTFKIVPVAEPLMIIAKDIIRPDILKGEVINTWLGIPVVNTTNRRLFNIQLQIEGKGIKVCRQKIPNIMPLSAIKVPIKIESEDMIKEVDSLLITINISFRDFSIQKDFWMKVKDKNESYVKTFTSKIDNSCQYYAILPPKDYHKDSTYALIMTCHGAGVKAQNQVNAYTQKDWTFVVAPTNRRRFGFDWQDWGRLDFLEVLEDVKKHFNIDTNRIYLTGHSMGGHGAWHIGTSHPDIFAAMAPSAGWTSIDLYIPFFLQKSYTFAHPEQLKFRDMVLREDNPLLFLENLKNLPVYILQGGADDNVPPIQGRMFAKYLFNLNYNYIYNEVEKQGHWWNIDSTPATDCVDLAELMNFLNKNVRNPWPKKIVCKTSDIAHSNQIFWVRIDELEHIYQAAQIDIRDCLVSKDNELIILINTNNIIGFTLFLDDRIWQSYMKNPMLSFNVNGQMLNFDYEHPCSVSFYKKGNKFHIKKSRGHILRKTKNLYGPMKRAYFEPFILVYGTTGDSSSTENNLHQARMQSYTWWYRANGFVEVLPDTEVTKKIIKDYNLILFGNPVTNSILKWISYRLPLHIEEGRVIADQDTIMGDLCLIEIYPNPLNPDKFVLVYSPTSKEAEKLMGLFTPLYAGSGLPDFIVYDKAVLKYGWAGVVATGFFDKDWKFDEKLSYTKY